MNADRSANTLLNVLACMVVAIAAYVLGDAITELRHRVTTLETAVGRCDCPPDPGHARP